MALTRAEGKEGRDRGRMKPGSGCTEKAESGGRERGFHGGPVVRLHASTAVGTGSIPGQETKILHSSKEQTSFNFMAANYSLINYLVDK